MMWGRIEGLVNEEEAWAMTVLSVSCNWVGGITLVCEGISCLLTVDIYFVIIGGRCLILSTLGCLGVVVIGYLISLLKI